MMTTVAGITDSLAAIVLGLTPVERLDATRRAFSVNFMTQRWFTVMMVVVIIVCTVLLFIVSYKRTTSERKVSNHLFGEYAGKTGLTERERQVLLAIVGYAGLRENWAIFTTGSAFDRGATRMIEESLARQGAEACRQLKIELSYLREKLGFAKKRKKLSSRQIPVGRKVHITRRTNRVLGDIEATVAENSDVELMLKLAMPVKITFGEPWRVHCYFGASVWEFDTSVLSYDGDVLVLNHSDDVRFINRRRFLRVPVNKPAFIARFPFAKTLVEKDDGGEKGPETEQNSAGVSDGTWGPPEFVPAVVTELAGPGLRVEAPLEVEEGERVLVVFGLGEEKGQESSLQGTNKIPASRIAQDIGEVRHTEAIQNGFSIAVELVGLGDTDVDELVRATNAASLKAGASGEDLPASVDAEEHIPEPSAV
jgi:hypothetical protein